VVRSYLLNDLTGSFVGAETALPGLVFWPWATPTQVPLSTEWGPLASNLSVLGGPPGTIRSDGVAVPFTARETNLLINGQTGVYTGGFHPWTALCQVTLDSGTGTPIGSILERNLNGEILFSRFSAELVPEPSATLGIISTAALFLRRKR
jgi:hypothetical protein